MCWILYLHINIFNIKNVKYLEVSELSIKMSLSSLCSFYSKLSNCTEEISDCLLIPWPNRLVEHKFVEIHADFFKDCPSEELSDPAPVIVFALVITPICLIPAMVSLVVLKTKNGDGSAWYFGISTRIMIAIKFLTYTSPSLLIWGQQLVYTWTSAAFLSH